jgi:hypothetical protein
MGIKGFSFVFVFLLFLGLVSAGCCFEASSGLCTVTDSSSSCSSGSFTSGSCSDVSDCVQGCCILGGNTEFVTERTCEVYSSFHGFQKNWLEMESGECANYGSLDSLGACLFEGSYENDCVYTDEASCFGEFFEGQYCTDLDSLCEETEKTFCYSGDVYSKDSCGNPSGLIDECSYAAGSVCAEESSVSAYCRDLNCGVVEGANRLNGDMWCVSPTGGIYYDLNLTSLNNPVDFFVGGNYFRKYCLDGEVVTESCGEYRQNYCTQGKCVRNRGDECFQANLGQRDEFTGLWIDEELCDPEFCYVLEIEDSEVARDLGADMCMPKIPTGGDVGESSGMCDLGDYERQIKFTFNERKAWLTGFGSVNEGYGPLGLLELISSSRVILPIDSYSEFLSIGGWTGTLNAGGLMQTYLYSGKKYSSGLFGQSTDEDKGLVEMSPYNLPVNDETIDFLNERCSSVGDCSGNLNWIEVNGIRNNSLASDSCFISSETMTGTFENCIPASSAYNYKYKFDCTQYKPVSGSGYCDQCGEDGIPCTRYRCEALGQGCRFTMPFGVDSGYCVSSDDLTMGEINYNLGYYNFETGLFENLIEGRFVPPYSAVRIDIGTDEVSSCRFEVGSAGATYDEMYYNVDDVISLNHSMILSIPGQNLGDLELEEHSLISSDGHYEVFVRCMDLAGNWNLVAKLIEFDVMETPDGIPPQLSEFSPVSGSPIEFNTTEKDIEFRINEPAECRWSFDDEDFESMPYSFDCPLNVSSLGVLEGYWCSGTLTNVTETAGESTAYYIRCKDQPWLAGEDSDYYSRNVNTFSREYSLRASSNFVFAEISPEGPVVIGPDRKLQLNVRMQGGGFNGVSHCKWKLSSDNYNYTWKDFNVTNSVSHSEWLYGVNEGSYLLTVSCDDGVGNVIYDNASFSLSVDVVPPIATRVYNDKGNLLVYTNENADCYYQTDRELGCYYNIDNATKMTEEGDFKHTVSMEVGKTYYVKCADIYDNVPVRCTVETGII